MPRLLVTATAAAIALLAAAPLAAATLTVAFAGIATPTGAVLLSVYDSEAAFDAGGKPIRRAMVPVTGAAIETVIGDLAPGRYAIKAFHDVDGDGKMAANPFGQPLEPYAFSNDAVGDMGPAKWAQAVFTVDAAASRHVIAIR